MRHISVLTEEIVAAIKPHAGAVVVDCTLGSAGHAEAILPQIVPGGAYVAIDIDPTAIERAQRTLAAYEGVVKYACQNFTAIASILASLKLEQPDAIIADLGWRIEQFLGESGVPRGFSFLADEPLLMTYGDPDRYSFTAYDIVNEWREEDITNVLLAYGEERYARRIAGAIVRERQQEPIKTARGLAAIIRAAVPGAYRNGRTHPATKSFQALRIAVNDEFDVLEALIRDGFEALRPGGRLAIITFHSLEDRIVKERFRTYARDGVGLLVSKKPITASRDTIKDNPRARSAKLRTIEKI